MRVIASILCFLFLVSGCSNENKSLERALSLRSKLQESSGCCFHTVVTADYGEKLYMFAMECQTDREGNLLFTVTEPASIAGITGSIDNDGGAITFDDAVLAFQTIADDQVTPVTAPWLLIKTLRSGYLKGCTETDSGFQISIDDSYEENALHLNIWTDRNLYPVSGEIFWQGRRVLTISVEEFAFL